MSEKNITQKLAPYSAALLIILIAIFSYSLYQSMQKRMSMRSLGDELKLIESTLNKYYTTKGTYPNNVDAGIVPPGNTQLLELFKEPTPVGGRYDWEGPDDWGFAAVSIKNPQLSLGELLKLDQEIDNGKLYTGKFRLINNAYFWVIREAQ